MIEKGGDGLYALAFTNSSLTDQESIHSVFEKFGEVVNIRGKIEEGGWVFVRYREEEEAERALDSLTDDKRFKRLKVAESKPSSSTFQKSNGQSFNENNREDSSQYQKRDRDNSNHYPRRERDDSNQYQKRENSNQYQMRERHDDAPPPLVSAATIDADSLPPPLVKVDKRDNALVRDKDVPGELFIANLPKGSTREFLISLCESTILEVHYSVTQHEKIPYVHVYVPTEEMGQAIVKKLNGAVIGGNVIIANTKKSLLNGSCA